MPAVTLRASSRGADARPLLPLDLVSAAAPADPSKYWYRRLAIAAVDVRRAVTAIGKVDTGSGAGPPLTAWVVGEGVVLTASREKGEPVKVVLADGSERRVRAVRRPDAAPELTFLSV